MLSERMDLDITDRCPPEFISRFELYIQDRCANLAMSLGAPTLMRVLEVWSRARPYVSLSLSQCNHGEISRRRAFLYLYRYP